MRSTWTLVFVLVATGCQQHSPPHAAPLGSPSHSADAEQVAAFWKEVASVHFAEDRSHAGQPLPTALLTAADGKPVSLDTLKGKPALVNFWAHWCVPCRAEMPTLNQVAAARANQLNVVAVNEDIVRPEGKSLGPLGIAPQVREWSDAKGLLAKTLASGGLPTTVFYGSDGRERWRLLGVLDWTKPQAQALIKEAM